MASPRAYSMFKNLSPNRIQCLSKVRQALSPKSPVKNLLRVEDAFQNIKSPIFNIDTPQRRRITSEGFRSQCHTVIGNGAFGTVYKATYKGQEVAAKIINKNKFKNNCMVMEKEASFLRHSNIVKILKVDEGPALTLITMELCGTSLQNVLEENFLTNLQTVKIWNFLAEALKYCHQMGIVHADVKPKNVLMDLNNQPKLTDFGSAVFINKQKMSLNFHGTPGYAAPEVVRGKIPIPYSDIYSLGTLAWQMISKTPPFHGLHMHTILYLTGTGKTPSDHNIEDGFDGKYKKIYQKCWDQLPQNRPNLDFVIEHLKKLEVKIS